MEHLCARFWALSSRRPLLGAGGSGGEGGEKGSEGAGKLLNLSKLSCPPLRAVREIHAVVSNVHRLISHLFPSLTISVTYRLSVPKSHASTEQLLLCEMCSETHIHVRGKA